AALLADAGDDGALDAADDMRTVVEFFDHLYDSPDLFFSDLRFEYDDQMILRLATARMMKPMECAAEV
ncbi:MAG: hypothetical protein WBG26_20045, partial [Candidatus Binataceae bacterium]